MMRHYSLIAYISNQSMNGLAAVAESEADQTWGALDRTTILFQ